MKSRTKRSAGSLAVLLISGSLGWAQALPQAPVQEPQPFPQQETPLLTPQQLDNLVAPVALYPDELLSQILAASTYPLEIVDAEQWMQQNRSLPPAQIVSAAKQRDWDPSVQALAAFPDVLDILGRDIHWTTDLGNAFLAQQADVMGAIQRMRARAQQSGQLRTTPQQTVNTQYQDGQSAIQIAPADPQTVYVPEYQPSAVWGPPEAGAYPYAQYPALSYPPAWGGYGGYAGYGGGYGYGGGIGFSPGIFLGGLFNGLLNFGPWGWGLNWFAHALFLIPQFFAHFGFGGGGYGGFYAGHYGGALIGGHPAWVHDPAHRLGVPYGRSEVASRFGGRVGNGFGARAGGGFAASANRGVARAEAPRAEVARAGLGRAEAQSGGAWRGAGGGGERNGFAGETRSASGNQFAARTAPQASRGGSGQSFRGSTAGPGRSMNGSAFSMNRGSQQAARLQAARPQASRPEASRPQSAQRSFSAPRSVAPAQRSSGSAPHASAPHSGGSARASNSHSSGGGHSGGGHSSGHRG